MLDSNGKILSKEDLHRWEYNLKSAKILRSLIDLTHQYNGYSQCPKLYNSTLSNDTIKKIESQCEELYCTLVAPVDV